MCQSQADGGRRCAAHSRPRYQAAVPGTQEWNEAAAAYASTRSGAAAIEQERLAAESAGDVHRAVALGHALTEGQRLRERAAEVRSALQAAGSPTRAHLDDVTAAIAVGDRGRARSVAWAIASRLVPDGCDDPVQWSERMTGKVIRLAEQAVARAAEPLDPHAAWEAVRDGSVDAECVEDGRTAPDSFGRKYGPQLLRLPAETGDDGETYAVTYLVYDSSDGDAYPATYGDEAAARAEFVERVADFEEAERELAEAER